MRCNKKKLFTSFSALSLTHVDKDRLFSFEIHVVDAPVGEREVERDEVTRLEEQGSESFYCCVFAFLSRSLSVEK